MDLDMIQYLFLKAHKVTFGQMSYKQKILMDHRFIAYKKIKKILIFYKFFIFSLYIFSF